ncbi:hypothetical protein HOV93_13720 [Planctomycetes bacterium FF15]|uniref:Uncharacterized protein n=2 Tax=Bremerella alba TaxID=980252 RepID=A0A7V9A6Q9_9BACT|nr:hypothetical protein [Bremerella alba]
MLGRDGLGRVLPPVEGREKLGLLPVDGRLIVGRLDVGRFMDGELIDGRLVEGRLVDGRLIEGDGRLTDEGLLIEGVRDPPLGRDIERPPPPPPPPIDLPPPPPPPRPPRA